MRARTYAAGVTPFKPSAAIAIAPAAQRRPAVEGREDAARLVTRQLDGARRPHPGLPPQGEGIFSGAGYGHSFGRVPVNVAPLVQAKLKISQPGDHLEREADRLADQVVRSEGPGPAGPRYGVTETADARAVLRQVEDELGPEEPYRESPEPVGLPAGAVEEEEEVEEEETVQAKADGGLMPTLTPPVEAAISSGATAGRPVDGPVRAAMEPRFGVDFSRVRIHDDAEAGRLSTEMNARAFTVGRDIYFAPGEYQPQSQDGRRLLAHELTHVVQQAAVSPAERSIGAQISRGQAGAIVQRDLATAFSNYRGSCDCGENLGNNCAHYLSDALIRAGYSDLDGGTGALYRRRNGRIVCKSGRPVRAAELRDWFAAQATDTHEGEPTDDSRYWSVYQRRHTDGQGHVVIHHHSGAGTAYTHAGTGDYPSWRTQSHYTW
jgi:hypothetical protein